VINLPSAQDVIEAIFGYGHAKAVLFAIILLVIAAVMLLYQQRVERVTWKVIVSIMATMFAVALAYYNFAHRSDPAYVEPKEIWMGDSSENVSDKDIERLEYLQDNFVIAKRSYLDTPSRYDYSDDGSTDYLDRAGQFYKSNEIAPEWDVHIYRYENMVIFRVVLFYANQRNVKHDLDFEYIEFYYRIEKENSTRYMVPDYASFPTYARLIEHPRIFLTWDQMPGLHGDIKCLALDPDTNSFAQKYDKFPKYNENFRPTWVSPEFGDTYDYLTETERIQFFIGMGFGILGFLNIIFRRPDRLYVWTYFIIVMFAIGLFPLISLQFDFVVNPTFRVWVDEKPDDTPFYQSVVGNIYIEHYDNPWNRGSWDAPDNKAICST
jgi:hypothetical protein